jgi:hypothetical protein
MEFRLPAERPEKIDTRVEAAMFMKWCASKLIALVDQASVAEQRA